APGFADHDEGLLLAAAVHTGDNDGRRLQPVHNGGGCRRIANRSPQHAVARRDERWGAMTLQFGVLGPVEVRDDGGPIALGGPQQRRILAALLAEQGKVVAVDRLVDAIWPEAPPDGARRTVMTYVSRLRQSLGDGYVVTQEPGYR